MLKLNVKLLVLRHPVSHSGMLVGIKGGGGDTSGVLEARHQEVQGAEDQVLVEVLVPQAGHRQTHCSRHRLLAEHVHF